MTAELSMSRCRLPAVGEEQVAWGLGLLLFPSITFLIVVLGRSWIWDYAELVLLGLPALFSVMTYFLARWLGATVGFALTVTASCGLATFLSACGAGLIVAVVSFFESFPF